MGGNGFIGSPLSLQTDVAKQLLSTIFTWLVAGLLLFVLYDNRMLWYTVLVYMIFRQGRSTKGWQCGQRVLHTDQNYHLLYPLLNNLVIAVTTLFKIWVCFCPDLMNYLCPSHTSLLIYIRNDVGILTATNISVMFASYMASSS